MVTREDLLKFAAWKKEYYKYYKDPIYRLLLFENPDKELIYHTPDGNKPSGFPDLGASNDFGFFYNLDDAIETMHDNVTDLRETVYNAGFILCHFEGISECATDKERMYFVWDKEKEGFYEADEPEIFRHIAYSYRSEQCYQYQDKHCTRRHFC